KSSITQQFYIADINPCKESGDSQNMCSTFFQTYKNCRKYWHNIMVQRRRDGVKLEHAHCHREMLTAMGSK
uniref:Coiled-coil-helix-coiled-coil-helix domain containing 7 n=1 Tax=Amphilophus citrinellus TaxID=61819 RepID=A0A3Q0RFI7_AMPCI